MKWNEYLNHLRQAMCHLPEEEQNRRIEYIREMLDDLMEEGKSEEEAVAVLAEADGELFDPPTSEASEQAADDLPTAEAYLPGEDVHASPIPSEKEDPQSRTKKRTALPHWAVILLILGSPIWLSILLSLIAIALAIGISLIAVIISLIAVLLSLLITSTVGVWGIEAVFAVLSFALFSGAISAGSAGTISLLLLALGGGCVFGALSIVWFYAAKWFSKAIWGGLVACIAALRRRTSRRKEKRV